MTANLSSWGMLTLLIMLAAAAVSIFFILELCVYMRLI